MGHESRGVLINAMDRISLDDKQRRLLTASRPRAGGVWKCDGPRLRRGLQISVSVFVRVCPVIEAL